MCSIQGPACAASWISASPAARSSRSAPSLPANEARRTISAKGRLVTPGLVDIHAHVFRQRARHGRPHRLHLPAQRRHHVVRRRQRRFVKLRRPAASCSIMRCARGFARFVNLSAIGITGTSRGGELSHLPYADPEGCARTIIENPDLAIGVKLRFGPGLVWEYSAEPVKLARQRGGYGGRRADDDAHHRLADPAAGPDRAHEAGRYRHALLSWPGPRHHGPGEAVPAEGGGRGAARTASSSTARTDGTISISV